MADVPENSSTRTLDFGSTGMWWEVTKTTEETNGASFEAINVIAPGFEGPPLHIHPHAEEVYAVQEGRLDVCINGHWRTLHAGESATVPAGVPHTLKNPHPEEVRLHNIHQPALDIEHMFRRMQRLIADGRLTLPPKTFSATILISLLFVTHSKEIRSIKPPHGIMRVFALLGKCLGYRLPE
jgi:mannose-6-phosphate isomerase-like protein (cupin superfamily)